MRIASLSLRREELSEGLDDGGKAARSGERAEVYLLVFASNVGKSCFRALVPRGVVKGREVEAVGEDTVNGNLGCAGREKGEEGAL